MNKLHLKKILVMFFLMFFSTLIVIFLRESNIIEIPKSPQYREKGPDNAKIKIIEFSDFGCPACAMANKYLNEILKVYKDRMQLSFKYFPLTDIHPNSFSAAIYAECAGKQGKFWEFGNMLFENQEKWALSKESEKIFMDYIVKLNLDIPSIQKCINDKEIEKTIKLDMSYGDLKKVDATPTFFINGKRAVGSMQLIENIKKAIAINNL